MVNLKVYLEIKVIDKKGKVRFYRRKNSAVYNLGKILYGILLAIGGGTNTNVKVKDYSGAEATVYTERKIIAGHAGGTVMAGNASEGDDTYGIMVGSDNTPVSDDDYCLKSKIAHGDGDNLLHYSSHTFEDVEVGTSYARFRMSRSFTNNGSVNVTVYEFGLGVWNYWKHHDAVYNDVKFLVCRDVESGGVTVNPSETLVVLYTFEVTL
ncbi:MAG: hypothetical protein B6U75_03480 [Desulfurococcales archaeon ex4484_217_1]|nr:MAG: hypothetical protein B6U75_03480 [Desulfurococcales archaeon ex4484_217_1]